MAHMLVQQQTPNVNIHQTTSTQDENLLPMAHSFDDRLFFYKRDSTCLLKFLQKFASEPQITKFQPKTNGFLNQNLTFLPLDKPEQEEKEEEEINNFNFDQIQPITTEDTKCNELDNISAAATNEELDEDIILNTNSTLNTELNTERHFRRRKRRSTLTKISSSNDETEPLITDSIEKN